MTRLILRMKLIFLIVLLGQAALALGDGLWVLGNHAISSTNVPIARASILQISCGRDHVVGVRRDGSIFAWGENGNGQTQVPAVTNAISVVAGTYHTLALLADGTISAWGFNGDGLITIPKTATNVIQIAAGTYHSLALRQDGSIVGWGYSRDGRTVAPKNVTGIVSVAVGRDHSVALRRNGRVVCWGLNDAGQTNTPATLEQVVAIAAGDAHTLALRNDGTVVAWGNNDDKQCTIPAGLSGVVAIAAGYRHSVALKSDGTVVAWGNNKYGQTSIPADAKQIVAIAANGFQTALLQADGARIVSQPASQTWLANRTVEFTVAATGQGSLTYRWFHNGVPLTDSDRIQGSALGTLKLSQLTRQDAGAYSVDIYDGKNLVRSSTALLVIRPLVQLYPPQIAGTGKVVLSFGDVEGDSLTPTDLNFYELESTTTEEGAWQKLDLPLTLNAGFIQATDVLNPAVTGKFYRLGSRQ